MKIQDPGAEHEIRIRFLGNSEVFVTCKCYDKTRKGWRGKTMKHRLRGIHHVRQSADWKSLGDFPVGTPTEILLEAYQRHLEGLNDRPESSLQARTAPVAAEAHDRNRGMECGDVSGVDSCQSAAVS